MTSGLHSCKPGNEPQVGQVKTFLVQQMTGKSGNPYTKIKSANAENGGQPYKITKVSPTGHTDSYGNISFNIEIEPSSGSVSGGHTEQRGNAQAGVASTRNVDDRSNRIERQHSQEMALRYLTIKISGGEATASHDTQLLRGLIDWFQRDIGRLPEAAAKPKPQRTVDDQIHGEQEPPPDDNDEPF